MDPFDCRDYRDSLRLIFATRSKILNLTQYELAERVSIQPPFLSKVFSKRAHFCREQLDLCISSLRCQKRVSDFIFLLHDFNLSKNFERRERLSVELSDFVNQPRSVSDLALNANSLATFEGPTRYFCDPLYSLVHMALTIDVFRENPSLLANILKIEPDQINKSIKALFDCGVVSFNETGKIILQSKDVGIERSHEQFDSWRLATLGLMTFLEKSTKRKNSIQVQGFFSVPAGANLKIKEKILKLLSELKELSEGEPESKVVALNLNYFEVT